MQLTYKIPVESLNSGFLDTIKANFAGKEVSITVEDVPTVPTVNQKELYKKSLALLERFKDMKVDPTLNLSDLANEVNL
ncbi:hypothetical protein GCM10028803_26860 [Larkinella knui]|uniref:Uncharacterized protein n=1 Tax=Larkinella knui TaxID=2025310 RepID=A0A3P1CWE8_9BACT|nr:hypothetical protein [Larkinella knui]RRB17732.1 hypothetical protein EHT87_05485 [Larkinella knui]